jgi:hypothetical protein
LPSSLFCVRKIDTTEMIFSITAEGREAEVCNLY